MMKMLIFGEYMPVYCWKFFELHYTSVKITGVITKGDTHRIEGGESLHHGKSTSISMQYFIFLELLDL